MTRPDLLVPGPVELRVTRWKCPHCPRSASTRARSFDHIGRCWRNPARRGCKTCVHFVPYNPAVDEAEHCAAGVDLIHLDGGATTLRVDCDTWEAA